MIEELYAKYHSELVKWCAGMTGSIQTAEELVQEAFLRAMLHEELLTLLDEKQGRSWLYRTVKNLYIDRKRHTSRESIVEETPENQKEPEEIVNIEWEMLLNSLPDVEGVLLTLRYVEGFNSKQIGELLSLPSGTVRSKLSLARRHLKEAIEG